MRRANDKSGRPCATGVLRPALAASLLALFCLVGCTSAIVRQQSPDEAEIPSNGERLIGDLAVPVGIDPIKVEAVALVTRLDGTGSDPGPSVNRAALIKEMRGRGVRNPNQVLASPDTSMVLVRGFLRGGIQKGEAFDLEIQLPSDSDTTSLRGGWLLTTELKPYQTTNAGVLSGHAMAFGEGPLLVHPLATKENNPSLLKRAYVPGGGKSFKSRTFGLQLVEDASIPMSQRVGDTINRRFHTYSPGGIKKGVATPKEEDFIQLAVHPRYKDNLERFIQVVRSLPLQDRPELRQGRAESLRRQLLDPLTSLKASLQLEAMGKDGIEALKEGLRSENSEVRFYSAESLAYLDEQVAAEVLGEAARKHPAFRVYALSALSAMDDPLAHDVLYSLLKEPSAETRYGAFRALWAMRADDPTIAGERLGKEFTMHLLRVDGPSMIHVTRSYRPEIVLFGEEIAVRTPIAIEAGKDIVVKETPTGELAVTNFRELDEGKRQVVPARVDAMIRAIQQVGGNYPDVIQAIYEAKSVGSLTCRIEIDALPQPGRRFDRDEARVTGDGGETALGEEFEKDSSDSAADSEEPLSADAFEDAPGQEELPSPRDDSAVQLMSGELPGVAESDLSAEAQLEEQSSPEKEDGSGIDPDTESLDAAWGEESGKRKGKPGRNHRLHSPAPGLFGK